MSEKQPTQFIVITESVFQSWARDASTLALFVSLIGIGIALDSPAMQWVGALVGFITITARASGKAKKLTKEQALRFIQDLDA
ncbi:hypothetical protein G9X67_34765 [Rhizobium sp. WYCCWR 11152]|uniref:hypothetical protein n=1 Tax=Rhizobium sp. WYCCWR 11152 TaxID=2692316 RepID=UPI0014916FC3|nr:hypothetical protein [Rhizobium sp. WYCCWR 11152]NNU70416.1 hypothetical protein [Rhizobium sp. WYCCWR 11152]